MQTFYSTIFVAVLGLFGLLVAALFYVAQMVHTRHSSARAQELLHGQFSKLFWFFGLLTLVMTSIGLIVQSFSISNTYFLLATNSGWFGSLSLLGLGLTFVFFIVAIRHYARMLSPSFLAHELVKAITFNKLKEVALFRLDVTISLPLLMWTFRHYYRS